MANLDEYLTNEYLTDKRELQSLEADIEAAARTLLDTFVDGKGWPYRLKASRPEKPEKLSFSTTAMVALSLVKVQNLWTRPEHLSLAPSYPIPMVPLPERAKDVTAAAIKLLISSVEARNPIGTESGTYGDNDPITLSFLTSLLSTHAIEDHSIVWTKIRSYVEQRCSKLVDIQRAQRGTADHARFFDDKLSSREKHEVVANALIPLRIVQATLSAGGTLADNVQHFRSYFETTLHDHLSFSLIPDSRFDPAELAFCLEGMLLAQRNAVDRSVFKRVLDVLSKEQEQNAFWRPSKPFLATSKGMSLFPVSIEVANSLLRSCEIFDGSELHETFGSASLRLLRRYSQWLRARRVTFDYDGYRVVGWNSEHVNDPEAIHVWETSQVLEFLLAFHRLLQAHIARRSLVLSRFEYTDSTPGTAVGWSSIRSNYEPVSSLGPEFEVYSRLGKDFVEGRSSPGKPKQYSILLFGPPGTGKSTIAENLASALGFRLIKITVSDFLVGGGELVEARAKAIFDVLRAQWNSVILFDEIDHFLLDRDSKRYAKQETVFQFMTPGMLTKLNDLRKTNRSIFLIATNYESRIDPAIKRPGRIDRRYLVLPPDMSARRRDIQKLLKKYHAPKLDNAEIDEMAKNSVLLGFKEMEGVISRGNDHGFKPQALLQGFLDAPRTTRLASFRSRLTDKDSNEGARETPPVEEFVCLLALVLEAGCVDLLDKEAGLAAKEEIGWSDDVEGMKKKIVRRVPNLAPVAVESVAIYLAAIRKDR